MSTEVNTLEQISVCNRNDTTAMFLQELNRHYKSINYDSIYYLEITLDGHSFVADSYDNPMLAGVLEKNVQHPFYQMLEKAASGKDFFLKIGYRGFDEKYGYAYWLDCLSVGLRSNVVCKCLEYYDQDEAIVTYVFDEHSAGVIPWNSSKEDVADVSRWYSYNFSILVETEETDLTQGETGNHFENICQRLTEFDDNILADLDEDMLEVYHSVSLPREKIQGFAALLKELAAYCKYHGLSCRITAPFVADDPDCKFAALNVQPDSQEHPIQYCRF